MLLQNKEDRKKVREVITLKKDTGGELFSLSFLPSTSSVASLLASFLTLSTLLFKGLEAEVRRLSESERKNSLSATEKERLAALRSEVERIKKTKEDYLEKHPEHRKFVYPNEEARLKAEKEKEDNKGEGSSSGGRGGPLYGKDGRLVSSLVVVSLTSARVRRESSSVLSFRQRNPERSVYYDPVLNPYGAPPPGMPYMERRSSLLRLWRRALLPPKELISPLFALLSSSQSSATTSRASGRRRTSQRERGR